jgi:uncharacterized protein (DUF2164 family)
MVIQLSDDVRKQAVSSIRRYFDEVLDQDIGDLKGEMMLEFILKEIAPSVYNKAIQDAQTLIQERVTEMDSSLFAKEFAYFDKGVKRK